MSVARANTEERPYTRRDMWRTAEAVNAVLRMRITRPRTALWVSAIRPTVGECGFDGGEIPTTDYKAGGC